MSETYKEKYLKYKQKYLALQTLKAQYGGNTDKVNNNLQNAYTKFIDAYKKLDPNYNSEILSKIGNFIVGTKEKPTLEELIKWSDISVEEKTIFDAFNKVKLAYNNIIKNNTAPSKKDHQIYYDSINIYLNVLKQLLSRKEGVLDLRSQYNKSDLETKKDKLEKIKKNVEIIKNNIKHFAHQKDITAGIIDYIIKLQTNTEAITAWHNLDLLYNNILKYINKNTQDNSNNPKVNKNLYTYRKEIEELLDQTYEYVDNKKLLAWAWTEVEVAYILYSINENFVNKETLIYDRITYKYKISKIEYDIAQAKYDNSFILKITDFILDKREKTERYYDYDVRYYNEYINLLKERAEKANGIIKYDEIYNYWYNKIW